MRRRRRRPDGLLARPRRSAYYRHQKSNTGRLEDTTGCGNTLDFTNTHVVTFAIDSLRYWAKRIGIDGFRFDLGVTLARLEGEFTHHHPFLYALRSDLLLGNLKLIMEPWDLGNLGWRTGQFSVPFAEWNDRFRDTARTFWLEDVDGGSDFGRISCRRCPRDSAARPICSPPNQAWRSGLHQFRVLPRRFHADGPHQIPLQAQ